MKNKKRWPLILALWIVFGLLVAGVAYLSFQNGEDAKLFGKQVITKLAEVQYSSQEISENDMNHCVPSYWYYRNNHDSCFMCKV